MGHKFAEIAFTPIIREIQSAVGSRSFYADMDNGDDYNHLLRDREINFITARDSFYMASVTETGWPYIQHRGGLPGFMKVLDEQHIGFADYSGNRQYVSTGNFTHDSRVALFFMDYPNRRCLKMLGRVQIIGADDQEMLAKLEDKTYGAQIERGFIIQVEAFDWNCPQHITQRFTAEDVDTVVAPLQEEIQRLRASQNIERHTVLGTGELNLTVSGIRQLTPRVRGYELRDPDGAELPAVSAGAHLQFPVVLENGEQVNRHYSITSDPSRRDAYQIAVLREDQGGGGSLALHQIYQVGTTLHIAQPENHFALHNDSRPAVLIAGGIGITPLKAMAHTLLNRGVTMQLHYAGRSWQEMPFADQLQRLLGNKVSFYPADEKQRLDVETVLTASPADALIYICGPARLIDGVIATAKQLGIDPERIRFERFEAGVAANAKTIQVELARSGTVIEVAPEQTVLDAMIDAGINAPFSCKTGACRTCVVQVIEGEAEHRDSVLTDEERIEQQLFCPCVSRAKTDTLTLNI